ncbi:MAG: hypothetical protein Sv326_0028 [Candidatus Fermentimicrarchaeum limneticum]|uniref:Uncharacterized protein n=1 Tax=Fermentimicrarchaeum limneticum TaxID=2795018 RepID=A0A7D6BPW4_FERL1|nr:MAG: hypothetical protein Sv326_0028 [Candidatus Fermentimicrarchaeum limneticum]
MNARYKATLLALVLYMGVASATAVTSMASAIATGLCYFRVLVTGVLPTLSLILFLFAGLAYAAGQAFGAETKAKAQGWAMSLLVGGIIGIVLAVLAPVLVEIFISMSMGGMVTPAC